MRVKNNRRTDYGAISKRSMKQDIKRYQDYYNEDKTPETQKEPEINAERRVLSLSENSSYYRYRFFIVGRLVRLIDRSSIGGWNCEFIHDSDRKALNNAAGWSDRKKEYLFDGIKFKK